MCDQHTVEDDEEFMKTSRRGFTVLSGAALAALMAAPANAAQVTEEEVKITTPDGVADCYFVHPSAGKHPAVLVWPDILGLRPAFRTMGKRLAEAGYSVLVVNPFYRKMPAPVVPDGASFNDPDVRGKVVPLMNSLTADGTKSDAIAFVAWIDKQKSVDTKKKMGTTGYCMGGPHVIRAAAAAPNRIAAGGTFHGASLATDKPDSPHLLIPSTKASFLMCIAQNDDKTDPTAKDKLRKVCDDSKHKAEIEVYPANHGWCALDFPVYDKEQAEKAWGRQLDLFKKALV